MCTQPGPAAPLRPLFPTTREPPPVFLSRRLTLLVSAATPLSPGSYSEWIDACEEANKAPKKARRAGSDDEADGDD